MSNSFWGAPDTWTCRGCPDGSPVNDDGLCEECEGAYRREYEEHLDQVIVRKYAIRCGTCKLWTKIHAHATCQKCIEEVYKPAGLWCHEHGPTAGRCPICQDQLTLEGV